MHDRPPVGSDDGFLGPWSPGALCGRSVLSWFPQLSIRTCASGGPRKKRPSRRWSERQERIPSSRASRNHTSKLSQSPFSHGVGRIRDGSRGSASRQTDQFAPFWRRQLRSSPVSPERHPASRCWSGRTKAHRAGRGKDRGEVIDEADGIGPSVSCSDLEGSDPRRAIDRGVLEALSLPSTHT